MACAPVLYIGNDNIVEFASDGLLTDATTGNTVDAATVGVRLLNSVGVEILASINMPAVVGQGGNYRGTIPDTFDLSSYSGVIAEITAENGANVKAIWKLEVKIRER